MFNAGRWFLSVLLFARASTTLFIAGTPKTFPLDGQAVPVTVFMDHDHLSSVQLVLVQDEPTQHTSTFTTVNNPQSVFAVSIPGSTETAKFRVVEPGSGESSPDLRFQDSVNNQDNGEDTSTSSNGGGEPSGYVGSAISQSLSVPEASTLPTSTKADASSSRSPDETTSQSTQSIEVNSDNETSSGSDRSHSTLPSAAIIASLVTFIVCLLLAGLIICLKVRPFGWSKKPAHSQSSSVISRSISTWRAKVWRARDGEAGQSRGASGIYGSDLTYDGRTVSDDYNKESWSERFTVYSEGSSKSGWTANLSPDVRRFVASGRRTPNGSDVSAESSWHGSDLMESGGRTSR